MGLCIHECKNFLMRNPDSVSMVEVFLSFR